MAHLGNYSMSDRIKAQALHTRLACYLKTELITEEEHESFTKMVNASVSDMELTNIMLAPHKKAYNKILEAKADDLLKTMISQKIIKYARAKSSGTSWYKYGYIFKNVKKPLRSVHICDNGSSLYKKTNTMYIVEAPEGLCDLLFPRDHENRILALIILKKALAKQKPDLICPVNGKVL